MRVSAIRIHAGEWSIEVPENWDHEIEDGTVSLFNPEGVGALTLSSASKTEGGDVSDEDLFDFIADAGLGEAPRFAARHGPFAGFHLVSGDEETAKAWQHWFLRADTLMLFVTYNCDEADNGKEDSEIDEALDSLRREAAAPIAH